VIAQGFAKCEKPERYIQQLVSHWGHKYATSYDEATGWACSVLRHRDRGDDRAPGGIAITLTTGDHERNVHMRG
jgi:hypothetical protein